MPIVGQSRPLEVALAGSQEGYQEEKVAKKGLQSLVDGTRICTQQRLAVLKERRLRQAYRCPLIIADAEEQAMPEIINQVCFRSFMNCLTSRHYPRSSEPAFCKAGFPNLASLYLQQCQHLPTNILLESILFCSHHWYTRLCIGAKEFGLHNTPNISLSLALPLKPCNANPIPYSEIMKDCCFCEYCTKCVAIVAMLQEKMEDEAAYEAAEAKVLTALLLSLPQNPDQAYSLDAPTLLEHLQPADAEEMLQNLFMEVSQDPSGRQDLPVSFHFSLHFYQLPIIQ